MSTFNFNGINLSAYNGIIQKKKIYTIAERDQSFNSVPGRNGDVIIDNGRYNNVTVAYDCGFWNIGNNIKNINKWLSTTGYRVLYDTYDTEYFRYGAYASKISIDEIIKQVGTAEISFNCKPFKYSWVGNNVITKTSSGFTINNPENFESEPYIKITGSGNVTLQINSKSYNITGISSYIEIDSELMSVFKGSELQNNKINFVEFPKLQSGNNTVAWTGTVTKIEIKPRWRTL